jgi:hypothetical protein
MSSEKNSIEAIMAQLQHLQSIVGAMYAGDSGLDFSGMMGNDDDVMPVVPIGGGIENFDLKLGDGTKKIGKGVVCIGRQHYLVKESGFQGDGQYRLKVDLNSMSVTVEKGDGFAEPEDEVSYIPLYEVVDGTIAKDYRSNFCVVARE